MTVECNVAVRAKLLRQRPIDLLRDQLDTATDEARDARRRRDSARNTLVSCESSLRLIEEHMNAIRCAIEMIEGKG